jgi:transposase-like protein
MTLASSSAGLAAKWRATKHLWALAARICTRIRNSAWPQFVVRENAEICTSAELLSWASLDRDLRQVRCKVIPDVKRETLQNEILRQVERGSKVYTDEAGGYNVLVKDFAHEIVNHAERYVNGRVHTNGLENFWSLLKRTLKGTYVAVEPFHLDHYLDEQVFRYNNRSTKDNPLNDSDRFTFLMSQVAGKRLTYAQLTGKGTDSLHHPAAEAGTEEAF